MSEYLLRFLWLCLVKGLSKITQRKRMSYLAIIKRNDEI